MNTNYVRCVFLLSLVLSPLLISGCSTEDPGRAVALPTYFPASGDITGWESSGDPELFAGEDLWSHINGGAEIYHEYGFQRVFIQEYAGGDGNSVIVESFEMSDVPGAYGIYSFKTGTKGEELGLSQGGLLEDYYLNFWKGRTAVTITGFDSGAATLDGLKAFAGFIEERIPDSGVPPSLIALLPEEGLNPLSIKFFKGNLGLFNSYAFDTTDIFGFDEAVKGGYQNGRDLFILSYARNEESLAAWRNAQQFIEKNQRYQGFAENPDSFCATDEKGRLLFLKPVEQYICIVLGAETREESHRLISQIW